MKKYTNFFLTSLLCMLALSPMGVSAITEPVSAQGRAGLIGSKFGIFTLDAQDVNGLSPVCKLIATYNLTGFWFPQLEGSPLLERPEYRIAKQVKSFHHYCRAEVARSRYFRARNPEQRNFLAKQIVAEIDFVISHPEYRPPDWPYLATMLVERGRGLLLLKDQARAIADFTEALRLDAANKDAYLALSDVYADLGQTGKALDYATEGLRHHPTAASLQRRYKQLGGNPPYPTPYSRPQEPSVDVGSRKDAGQSPPGSGADSDHARTDVPAAQAAPAAATPLPSGNPPPAGDSSNPYCRFCPQ